MKNKLTSKEYVVAAGSALAVFLSDQLAKWLVISYGPKELIPGFLGFRIHYNTGIALSIPLGSWMIVLLMIVAFFLVTRMFLQAFRAGRRFSVLAYGLLLGGALSNIVDRVRVGAVIDYVEIANTSIFNIADTAIIIGLVLFFWMNWKRVSQAPKV